MTGMAALAMCAAFTSCSKDKEFELITPEKQSELNYENAFKSKYGEIDPSHSWGFDEFKYKGNARTRATTYMNGNMEKYYNAPTVGTTEESDVESYVHSLTVLPGKSAPTWSTYFVTQIHDGNASYNTQKSVDGTNEYVGGQQMEELAFAMQSGASIKADGTLEGDWIHINNFNNANNSDWNGNTLVEDGGTVDFAYKSSVDSKYHNRWIGVDGANVPKTGGGNYAEYYYICFDFEATNDYAQTNFSVKWSDKGGNHDVNVNNVPGAWTIGSATAARLVLNVNGTDVIVGQDGYNITVTQTVGGNMVVNGNNDYTDWIVRLYKAKEKEEEFPEPDVRVLAEDLDVTETFNGQKYEGDFDFNDAVFDVIYNYKDATWIIVQAAGGTYPLYVDGNEVHAALGGATNQMINTDGTKNPSKPINLGKKYTDANDITVTVDLPSGTRTLEAGVGKAPHKLAVSPTFDWMSERVSIEEVHPNFSNWVKHSDARWY